MPEDDGEKLAEKAQKAEQWRHLLLMSGKLRINSPAEDHEVSEAELRILQEKELSYSRA